MAPDALTKEHAIRHVLQYRLVTCAVFKTDRVPDLMTNFGTHFLRNTRSNGHGRDTSRLCTSYPAFVRETLLCQVLCHLSRLAGTRVTDDDENLMLLHSQNNGMRTGMRNDVPL